VFLVARRAGNAKQKRYLYLRDKRAGRSKDRYIGRSSLVIVGREGSGKTRELEKLREKATGVFGVPAVFIPAQFPMSDWFLLNLNSEELKGLKGIEKKELFIRACKGAVVIVDDANKLTGQKLQLVKRCIAEAKYFVISTPSWRELPTSLRLEIEKRGFREVHLKSDSAVDISYLLIALAVVGAFIVGHYEIAFLLMGMRYFMRQK
jgi:hypothetical protein